ncbi:MAG: RNA polymerase sigma factor [Planctomycetota bacterium]|jgi:RNA polymerase sigma-70 factor (ECF subfamily)
MIPAPPSDPDPKPENSSALSFEDVAEKYYARVYRVALHLTSRHEDAEDVCQEVFLYLHKHLQDFRGESAIFTWIYRITRSTAFRILRKRGTPVLPDDQDREAPPGRESPAEQEEKRKAIQTAFSTLPDNPRVVATLHLIEGLPLKEVARLLEAPEGTVRWWMYRARERLQERLKGWVD